MSCSVWQPPNLSELVSFECHFPNSEDKTQTRLLTPLTYRIVLYSHSTYTTKFWLSQSKRLNILKLWIWTVMGAELGYNGLHSHVGNLIRGWKNSWHIWKAPTARSPLPNVPVRSQLKRMILYNPSHAHRLNVSSALAGQGWRSFSYFERWQM